jgi:hypothetical protein
MSTTSGETATGTAGQIDPAEGSRRLLEECFNDGNLALADELIAPDAVNHDPACSASWRGGCARKTKPGPDQDAAPAPVWVNAARISSS